MAFLNPKFKTRVRAKKTAAATSTLETVLVDFQTCERTGTNIEPESNTDPLLVVDITITPSLTLDKVSTRYYMCCYHCRSMYRLGLNSNIDCSLASPEVNSER